jgi:hypothetical protein
MAAFHYKDAVPSLFVTSNGQKRNADGPSATPDARADLLKDCCSVIEPWCIPLK